jgi:hypothetical protein
VSPATHLLKGLAWEQLFDGHPHRLKRGKHFAGEVHALQQEAQTVADREHRGLLTVRDLLGKKNQYLWVQFADQLLGYGQPCRCGGRELLRVHERFARCAACGGTAVLQLPANRGAVTGRLGQHLSDYDDLELIARDDEASSDALERWYGRATDPAGLTVLVQVDFPLLDGRRIPDPANPGSDVHQLRRWALEPFLDAARIGVLDNWEAARALRAVGDRL